MSRIHTYPRDPYRIHRSHCVLRLPCWLRARYNTHTTHTMAKRALYCRVARMLLPFSGEHRHLLFLLSSSNHRPRSRRSLASFPFGRVPLPLLLALHKLRRVALRCVLWRTPVHASSSSSLHLQFLQLHLLCGSRKFRGNPLSRRIPEKRRSQSQERRLLSI